MSVTIRVRRGTATQWAARTTALFSGEIGYDLTNKITKIGDGTTLWASLPAIGSSNNTDTIYSTDKILLNGVNGEFLNNTEPLNQIATIGNLESAIESAIEDANEYTDIAVAGLGNSLPGTYVEIADVGQVDGVAPLDNNALIPDSYIPSNIARDSEIVTSYNDLTDKPSIALGAVKWTANHTLLPGGENTRYLAGDIVWDGGNIYVANYDNESIPTSSTLYWTNIGPGKRLNIDGRDIPNIIWDNILEKPTIPSLTGYATETYVNTAVSNLVETAPETLNTLNELAAAINDDASFASTVTTALGNKLDSSTASSTYLTQTDASTTYAPINSPTFTGTVGGITKSMIDLANVDNTTDANKPVSTATQTALDLKLNLSEPSVDYYITNSGSGAYTVNGVSNGLITFEKGKKYRIHINASGHPFWIQTVSGAYSAGNVYSTGITNGGAQVGHILVELPQNAPDDLYYVCQYHSSMQGSISVQSQNTVTINSKSSSYTILPVDSGKIIEMSAGGTLTITDSASFPIGYSVDILQTGSSQVTIAGNGFTPNATPGLKLRTQWSSATLIKRALNSWVVLGDLSA